MKRIMLSFLLAVLALPVCALGFTTDDFDVNLYGRLWPKVTYSVSDNSSSTDITDALSRIGVTSKYRLAEDLSVVAQVEARVNLGMDGSEDFLTEHLGYVGLESRKLGLFAIGTQWNPYYNTVAVVTDVYYHRASPFGYDNASPYREEQIVRYANTINGIKLDVGAQMKDDVGNDHFDKIYAGVGYNFGSLYLGVGYFRHDQTDTMMGTQDMVGVGGSISLTDDIYFAATYQDIRHEYMGMNEDHYTLDVVTSLDIMDYTLIGGVFSFSGDSKLPNYHKGYNVTLVKQMTSDVSIFVEWLSKDFNMQPTENAVSFGVRVDFDVNLI